MVFSIQNAEEEIKLFTNAASTRLVRLEGGVHFLSSTYPQVVHQELLNFIQDGKRES